MNGWSTTEESTYGTYITIKSKWKEKLCHQNVYYKHK